jgi:hypothetical protein
LEYSSKGYRPWRTYVRFDEPLSERIAKLKEFELRDDEGDVCTGVLEAKETEVGG